MSTRHALSLALGVAFVILGTAFTVSPDLLDHAAAGFERRGFLHHVFHYLIWISGFTLVIGLLLADKAVEAVGLLLAGLAVTWNLVALLTDNQADVLALDIALRAVVICVVTARLTELWQGDR